MISLLTCLRRALEQWHGHKIMFLASLGIIFILLFIIPDQTKPLHRLKRQVFGGGFNNLNGFNTFPTFAGQQPATFGVIQPAVIQPAINTFGQQQQQFGGFQQTVAGSNFFQQGVATINNFQTPLGGYCSSANRVPYINPLNNIAQGCPVNQACPNGYICEISTTRQFLCCGQLGTPSVAGFIPYRDPSTGRAVACGGSAVSPCPTGARCLPALNGAPGQYLCSITGASNLLSTLATAACPTNFSPNYVNGRPQTCAVNLAGSCPSSFACVQASGARTFLCCRPTNPTNLCPGNQRPLSLSGSIQLCTQIGSPCTVRAYTCQRPINSGTAQGICCGFGQLTNQLRCPAGGSPYLLGINPFYCTPAVGNCPTGYTCQQASTGQFICCGGATAAAAQCRDRTQPSLNSEGCTLINGLSTCQNGFTCQQTLTPGRNACCRTPFCLNGGTFDPTGTCSLQNLNSCPLGATCEETSTGVYDCCVVGAPANCPANGILDTTSTCVTIGSTVQCSQGFVCERTSNGQLGCCANAVQPGDCPTGTSRESGNPACVIDNDCGIGFSCTQTNNGQLGCCSSGGNGDSNSCGNGQLPDLQNGQPRRCNINAPSCRQGYLCGANGDNTFNICCRGPRCPGGITVGQGADGQPLECTTGGNQCPNGQTCRQSINFPNLQICCPNNRRNRPRIKSSNYGRSRARVYKMFPTG